ncbi:hypothetical protein [Demequina sp. NBRC 110051]|uniref:hypothetical protein n=1 Tax=Demequina sp. NBRC 110051 TaxID=1570340 RepID=UPI0009FCBF3B|nr:hypothetical protein [Demequina sp. NBRC 110051]
MAMLPRTAVVVVHGIGEQEPLDTLLSFVGRGADPAAARTDAPAPLRAASVPSAGMIDEGDGVVDAKAGDRRFVLPDRLAGTSFGRIVSVDMRHRIRDLPEADDAEPRSWSRTTHFYEYYWAYRFRDTAWRHLPSFVMRLVSADRGGLLDGFMKGYGPAPAHTVPARVDRLTRAAAIALALVTGVLTAWVAVTATTDGHAGWLAAGIAAAVVAAFGAVAVAQLAGVLTTIRTMLLVGLTSAVGYVVGAVFAGQPMLAVALGAAAGVLAVVTVAGVVAWRLPTVAAAGLAVATVALAIAATNLGDPDAGEMWGALAGAQSFLGAAIPVVTMLVGGFALTGLGDAARYLSSKPDNISERENIRGGLVDLLTAIADDRDEVSQRFTYDRIVLVGHSLGTVIAADALHAYWNTVAPNLEIPLSRVELDEGDDDPAVTPLERAVRRVERHAVAGGVADGGGESDDKSGEAQRAAVRGDRAALGEALRAPLRVAPTAQGEGVGEATTASAIATNAARWIVTDLVTLACPLTHAEILVTAGKDALAEATKDRFLATSPPQVQQTPAARASHPLRYRVWTGVSGEDTSRLHQSAQFAATTWTNMFFTHDLVGGELGSRLGSGIDDHPVGERPATLGQFIRAYPHSSYWGTATRATAAGRDEVLARVKKLCFPRDPVLVVFAEIADRDALLAFVDDVAGLRLTDVAPGEDAVELRVLAPVAEAVEPAAPRQDWLWPGRPARIAPADLEAVLALARAHGLQLRRSASAVADESDVEDASE